MSTPKLAHPSSGLGGRGYTDLFRTGKVLPSITTALGAIDKPGLIHWHVMQTAMYAATHVEDLLSRTEEAGVRYLQYFSRRKPDDWDSDELNVYSASQYVLDDLSNSGTWIHKFIEDDLNGNFPEEPTRQDHYEMVEAYYRWKAEHTVEVIATESTVFGAGYAGTADLFAVVDGVKTCVDYKTSREIRESHIAQLSAIGAALFRAEEVPEGTTGAVHYKMTPTVAKEYGGVQDTWWVEREVPAFEAYAVLQLRPSDVDSKTGEYIDPFCKLHWIDQRKIDAGFDLFQAGLDARLAQKELNRLDSIIKKEASDEF